MGWIWEFMIQLASTNKGIRGDVDDDNEDGDEEEVEEEDSYATF